MDHPPRIVVATMTLVRDDTEDALIRSALTELSRAGLHVAVADGGSPAAFLSAVADLPGVELVTGVTGGLIAQVRASLDLALRWRPERVLYTEPDKLEFFSHALPGFLERSETGPAGSLVLAARSAKSFRTYPTVQQYVETVVNTLCAEATNVPADYSYGPFVCDAIDLDGLDTLPRDAGWGWRPYVFARLAQRGRRIVPIEGDYDCPASQRANTPDERCHRLRQLAQNSLGLSYAIDRSTD